MLIFAVEYLPFELQCICEQWCYRFPWMNFEGHWAKHLNERCGKDWLPCLLFLEINAFDNLCKAYRGHLSGSWIDQQPAKMKANELISVASCSLAGRLTDLSGFPVQSRGLPIFLDEVVSLNKTKPRKENMEMFRTFSHSFGTYIYNKCLVLV